MRLSYHKALSWQSQYESKHKKRMYLLNEDPFEYINIWP